MIAAVTPPEPLLREFLAILDEEIGLQEAALRHLAALADAVAARQDGAVERLLAEADASHQRWTALGENRRAVRRRLAEALLCAPDEVTLSRLAGALPAPYGRAVADRRLRISAAAEQVRRQHLRTAVLVIEGARLSRSLLAGLAPGAAPPGTYGAAGRRPWAPPGGLVDMRS
ncbi:MAG: flagellar protein FlgN [Planctomycetes bacterium]|nr:flagellar protein FlgN [Planctomycetota bacterium]